jgi:protein TonB
VQLAVLAVLLSLGRAAMPVARPAPGIQALDFPLSLPSPPPPPAAHVVSAPAAASGLAGVHAVPRAVTAPVPALQLAQPPAPQVSATGAANTSGLRDDGAGPGAGTAGSGGGNGTGGAGQGGGGSPLAQIAGSIDSAKDYPRAGRDARIGHSALITFTVGVDGRAHDCHVRESSGDPDSDAITCRLALERFRFRPATDAAGQPVEHLYGWRQKWFY